MSEIKVSCNFPSWTSRVRTPSPAPSFQQLSDFLEVLQKSSNGVQRSLRSSKLFILNGSVGKNASRIRWHSSAARNPLNLMLETDELTRGLFKTGPIVFMVSRVRRRQATAYRLQEWPSIRVRPPKFCIRRITASSPQNRLRRLWRATTRIIPRQRLRTLPQRRTR